MKNLARLVAGLLCGAALAAPMFGGGQGEGTAAQETGGPARLEYAEGTVRVDGQTAQAGQRLTRGQTLSTGPDGAAEVSFGPRNRLRLGPDSRAVFDLEALVRTIELQKGSLGVVARNLNRLAGGALEIRSPAVTAGVRGTSFFTRVDEGEGTYFCTCNGTVHLQPAGGNPFTESNAQHGAFYARQSGSQVTLEARGLEGHDNASLEALAARFGETVDWTRPDRD